MVRLLLIASLCSVAVTPRDAWAAPKKKSAKELKKEEEARLQAEKAKAEADAKAAEEARLKAEAEAKAAEEAAAAKRAEEARLKAEEEAATKAKADAEAAQAASMAAAAEAEAKAKADDAKRIEDEKIRIAAEEEAKKNERELIWVRAQLGTERYNVQYLALGGIPAAQKSGFGFSFDGAVGFRLGGFTRLGLEYQRTMLPSAAAWNKFMMGLDIVIPVWMLEPYGRVALGYGLLQADGRNLHGGVFKAGAGLDVRFWKYMSAGVGADFDVGVYYLGLLAQGNLGVSIFGRLTFLY